MRGGVSTATVRASADHGVEVLYLDRENFNQLMAKSEATKKEIERVAQRRLKEGLGFTEES